MYGELRQIPAAAFPQKLESVGNEEKECGLHALIVMKAHEAQAIIAVTAVIVGDACGANENNPLFFPSLIIFTKRTLHQTAFVLLGRGLTSDACL